MPAACSRNAMKGSAMGSLQKYGFRIKTRNGLILDNFTVQARDRGEAQRRITQIYHHCEILDCQENDAATAHAGAADIEGVIGLISRTRELPETSSPMPASAAPDNPTGTAS
jgi:hypothetical protein